MDDAINSEAADGETSPQPNSHEDAVDATNPLRDMAKAAGLRVAEADGIPVIRIGPDMNDVGMLLGQVVGRLDLYEMNGELVYFDFRGDRKVMTSRVFSTWINDHVVMALGFEKSTGNPVRGMLKIEESALVLNCQNFRRGVRRIRAVNHVRLPVIRKDGSLEKLPWGYDEEEETYTVPGGVDYDTEMALESAKVGLGRVDGDFPFSDGRSVSVQRAAALAHFCKHLPGGEGLRPGFLWLGNKPGCGKSVLAKSTLYPVLGNAAAAKMKKNEDLDKELEAFIRCGVPYIFLDNVYGGISSASLDQLLTSKKSTGRAMGGHNIFTADNRALVVVTGNRLELNEDAARRFAVVDLFEKGEPDQREITCRLDDDLMADDGWRKEQLSRLWALVRNWHEAGMPLSQVVMPTYERFCEVLGGIVHSAGYDEPFQRAVIPDSISPEKQEFAELLNLLAEEMDDLDEKNFTLQDMARVARAAQIFQRHVGTQDDGIKLTIKEDGLGREERYAAEDRGYMTPAQRSSFGKRIAKEIGGEPVTTGGRRIQFGERLQSRKAAFTLKRLD